MNTVAHKITSDPQGLSDCWLDCQLDGFSTDILTLASQKLIVVFRIDAENVCHCQISLSRANGTFIS